MLNLATVLESAARRVPDGTALTFQGKSFSYAEADALASRTAAGLARAGVAPGDRVALACPNLPQFVFLYFGILKCGAVAVPFNVLLKEDEVAFLLEDSGAVGFLCFEGTDELPLGDVGRAAFGRAEGCRHFWSITVDPAAPPPFEGAGTVGALLAEGDAGFETVQRNGEDTAVVLYTSGTTGRPKGAELTHNSLCYNAMVSRDLVRLSGEDAVLVVLPLFHVFGQVVLMLAGLLATARIVLLPRFEPGAVFEQLAAEGITVFAGVPTMYWGLLAHADANTGIDVDAACAKLRVCATGGAAMPVELLKAVEARLGVAVIEGYGLSETSPVVTFNHLDRERRPGSAGQAIWGVEVGVVDDSGGFVEPGTDGEIVVRGHCVMKGYLNRPKETEEAMRGGWFHTGDIGHLDGEGYLHIVDRVKDMVLRGGYNVYPREVEEVLLQHPGISLAAVVGVPHEEHGEEIKAFVVPEPGAELTGEEVVAFARERIAAYKYPRIVEFREALPMNATGKILKTELRKDA